MAALCLLRRFGWFVLVAGLLVWPRASYADQQVYGDFDGDGQRDHATFDPAHASMLRVWLSGQQRPGRLRLGVQLLHLTAIDLDGDGRPEIVATDRRAGLRVLRTGRARFKFYQYRRTTTPRVNHRAPGKTLEEEPSSSDDTAPSRAYGGPADLDACPPEIFWAGNSTERVVSSDVRPIHPRTFGSASPRAPPFLNS